VSYIKAPRSGDAHPGNSDPLDEQQFLVDTINRLEALPACLAVDRGGHHLRRLGRLV
jgi:hypothetical protein